MEVSNKLHDPNTCYSCIAKRVLEDTQDKKFSMVIVYTVDSEGFHASITGYPDDLTMDQKKQLVENFMTMLNIHFHEIPIEIYRSLK